jgi:hypothetical protein
MIDIPTEDMLLARQLLTNETRPTTLAEATADIQLLKRILRRLLIIWSRAYPEARDLP